MKYKEAHAKAVKEKRVEKVTPDYIEFKKEGMVVIGRFVGFSTVSSSRGEGTYNQYLFHSDAGLIKFAVGSATDKEIMPLLIRGQVYSVQYLGKEKLSGARTVNKFMVNHIELTPEELDELESINVSEHVAQPDVGGPEDKAF